MAEVVDMMRFFIVSILAGATLLSAACPAAAPLYVRGAAVTEGLPEAPEALVRLADEALATRPRTLATTDRALAALERALAAPGADRFEVSWRLARACSEMAEQLPANAQKLQHAERGVTAAEEAVALAPGRVEGHYYLGLDLAQVAETSSDMKMVESILTVAKAAVDIDPGYADAGPLRFLGKLYITAPPWPSSVGSPAKGVEALERAVELAPVAINRLFLGEAYYHDDDFSRAQELIEHAIEQGRDGSLEGRWVKEANDYLQRMGDRSAMDEESGF